MPRRNEDGDEGEADERDQVDDGDAGEEDRRTPGADADGDPVGDRQIYHRSVTPDPDEANQSLLRLVANLERCEVTDLPPLYDQVDHLVEHLFSNPPPSDAQAELNFSYHGYRIELDQTGEATFMKLGGESRSVSEE